jgi:predicted DNA-binding transcriptional regulator YafY
MARGDTAARQIRLWLLLQEQSELSVEDAAVRLGCTTRTVYRDLDGLQTIGLPLYPEPHGRTVRWKLADGFYRKLSVQFSVHEAISLAAAEQLFAAMQGSLFDTATRLALAKVRAALAPEIRKRVDALTRRLTTSAAPVRKLARQRPWLDRLFEAIERDEVLVVYYQKLGSKGAERYTIEPHSMNVQGSAVHVVLWARERNSPRVFLLDRFQSIEATGEHFTRRPELAPGAFDQGAFGLWNAPSEQIVLRFKGSAARIVSEQQFHPTQSTVWNHDGSLTMKMVTPRSPALKAWVRGFGKRVSVVEPTDLLDDSIEALFP